MQPEDDYYHPTNQVDDVVDVRGRKKSNSKIHSKSFAGTYEKNVLDGYNNKNLCIFNIPMEGSNKKYQIKCYKSGETNTRIVDAITGIETTHLVGSFDESFYFKVKDAVNSGGGTFFYSSPDQYERHLNAVLPSETKIRWLMKRSQ